MGLVLIALNSSQDSVEKHSHKICCCSHMQIIEDEDSDHNFRPEAEVPL